MRTPPRHFFYEYMLLSNVSRKFSVRVTVAICLENFQQIWFIVAGEYWSKNKQETRLKFHSLSTVGAHRRKLTEAVDKNMH